MADAAQDELVRRSRCGDAAAFAALIGSFERIALSLAYSLTRDASSAGDVVQDAFLRAWQRLGDLKESGKFGPWLCGIVRNLSIDAARARAVRASHLARSTAAANAARSVSSMATDPLDELDRAEERQRVVAAIANLDEMSRCAVMLRYYENLSSKQIGELFGVAPTAVDMRLLRARRQLRDQLTAAPEEDNVDVSGVEENGVAIGQDGERPFAAGRRRSRGAGRIV